MICSLCGSDVSRETKEYCQQCVVTKTKYNKEGIMNKEFEINYHWHSAGDKVYKCVLVGEKEDCYRIYCPDHDDAHGLINKYIISVDKDTVFYLKQDALKKASSFFDIKIEENLKRHETLLKKRAEILNGVFSDEE
jgi:hypothetical protein